MILLITPSSRAEECANALQQAIQHPVQISQTIEQASLLLRENEYLSVVLDQLVLEVEPDEGDVLHTHLGSAIPVYVNFAINSKQRIVHEVQAAMRRRLADERVARLSAQQALRNELNETVNAMLLSCDLLASSSTLPEPAKQKLRGVQELASHLQVQLGAVSCGLKQARRERVLPQSNGATLQETGDVTLLRIASFFNFPRNSFQYRGSPLLPASSADDFFPGGMHFLPFIHGMNLGRPSTSPHLPLE